MTHKSRYFATAFEAYAFASGLETASDGTIHHVMQSKIEAKDMDFRYVVRWTDENSDARRLQQEPHKPMTPQEYVREHKGNVCPVCGSTQREGHEVEYHHGDKLVTRGVSCFDCDASWKECYELSGYELED